MSGAVVGEVGVFDIGEMVHEGLAAGDGENHEDKWTND